MPRLVEPASPTPRCGRAEIPTDPPARARPDLMPSEPRSAPHHAASDEGVRRSILREADGLLENGDESQFSIRRLVARCGHPAPTIYRHFGDKSHLLGALLEARLAELAAELRAVPESDDPIDRLRALARVFARFGFESPTYYRLFTLAEQSDAVTPPSAATCGALLAEPLDQLADAGRISASELPLLKNAFWALVHGVVTLQLMRPEIDQDDRLLDVALAGMITGTIAPARSSQHSQQKAAEEGRS